MTAYNHTQLAVLTIPTVQHSLPPVMDDVSLAYSLGIRPKTLWWAVFGGRELAGTAKSTYTKGAILKRGKAGSRGALRAIHVPDWRVKNIQKVLSAAFVKPIPVGDHVRAYEPGVKPLDTAEAIAGSKILWSFDLKNFFGSIRLPWIREYYESLGYPRQVANLIGQLCCVTDVHPSGKGKVRFLPQGTVVSPALANRIADHRLDQRILTLAQANGWSYYRYSDNVYMGHPDRLSREEVDAFKGQVFTAVGQSGWRHHKSRVALYWNRQSVLGAVVNEKPNMPSDEYKALRAAVYNCRVHGFSSQVAKARQRFKSSITTDEQLISHLRGRLAYLKALLSEDKYNKLHDDFSAALEAHRITVQRKWLEEDLQDARDAAGT